MADNLADSDPKNDGVVCIPDWLASTEPVTAPKLRVGDVAKWIADQSEIEQYEDPNTASSSNASTKKFKFAPTKKLKFAQAKQLTLHFQLPCGNWLPYSAEEVVVRGLDGNKFRIKEIVVTKNPESLDAFIGQQFNAVDELFVNFHFGASIDDSEVRLQLALCLKALVRLAGQCAFHIKAEYTTTSKQVSMCKSLAGVIITRMRQMAGNTQVLRVLSN